MSGLEGWAYSVLVVFGILMRRRLAKKARINIQDNLAEALLQTWSHLRSIASDDFQDDEEIKVRASSYQSHILNS